MNNNQNPLISIIVPTYGRADMLPRAIDSLLLQSYSNIEIIVINDNKHESEHYQPTMDALDNYRLDSRVKVIADGENLGGSLARNKGIDVSNGQYITFLDDDDYYYKDKILKQYHIILENCADVCVCNMDILKNEKIGQDSRSFARVENIEQFLINGNCFTPMLLMKKDVLVSINGFTKAPRFQDHILMLKILGNNFKVCTLKESLFVHNDHVNERITKNKLDSYNVRWALEDEFLKNIKGEFLKKYWFNRNLNKVRVLRDNSKKLEAIKTHLSNIENIVTVNDTYFFIKIFFSILIK